MRIGDLAATTGTTPKALRSAASVATYRSAIADVTQRIDELSAVRRELVARLESSAERALGPAHPGEEPDLDDYGSLPADLPRPTTAPPATCPARPGRP